MNTPQVDTDALDRAVPDEPDELVLAAEFPAATREQWVELVDGVVRKTGRIAADAPAGAGAEKIGWSTPDGVRVQPLYTGQDLAENLPIGVPGALPFVRGSRAGGPVPDGWDVRQRHADPDPQAARNAIAADLENGVTSLWLAVGEHGTAVADLSAVLADVLLDLAPVVLDAGAQAPAAAEAFLALAAQRDAPAAGLRGNLGLDPIGLRARTGSGPAVESVADLARRVAERFPVLRAIVVDALAVHGAGSSDAQELGFSLAAGVAYLRALTAAGLDVAAAARLVEFRYAATGEQFATIAKLRAARRLWGRVLEASGADGPGQAQHAVSSPVMQSRRDPWVNLLRGTVAGFAAGVGGADAVTVAPFDAAIGVSEPFSRRIARNTQALLIEESHLARVIDPAGGSWYVEHLTDDLARAGWAFFQEIEAAGGAVAALDSGLVADRVAAVREQRQRAVAKRTVPLTGVSEFPDLDERPVARRPLPRPAAHEAVHGGLPTFRLAEPFEAYRDRSDEILARTGTRPTAFLATLGPLAAYTARAGFARNLLQAGGIAAPDAGPTETPEDVVAAFTEAGTPVAVLCSTDALYAERAALTAAALRAAGATAVLLAGRAEVPGVDGYLYAGCDALGAIEDVYGALEGAK
ncbi:methylmalonyl-CoA mutase family protein [Pseudonocardia asaccharolytica]|uniref:methylmalonyl-CoA mutase n=1 Tax=Pseudonocardia asaccharolytica DSM 44247 = NBRC 16224 TaxID=1123024 RepID=A0A511D3S9_9PSEU|nr:methylmalonyl-CoA mutase family protein [Pseudonocardia asaccharolytica]GEL19446.1 methylmalonyl-CoA mutase [Pseudonocardia asaccharolytica DSM 44247 = NBRC 16224]